MRVQVWPPSSARISDVSDLDDIGEAIAEGRV